MAATVGDGGGADKRPAQRPRLGGARPGRGGGAVFLSFTFSLLSGAS